MSTARRHPLPLGAVVLPPRWPRRSRPRARLALRHLRVPFTAQKAWHRHCSAVVLSRFDQRPCRAVHLVLLHAAPRGRDLDPKQRLHLKVAREAIDDAGETQWKGTNVGVYIGCYGQDLYDLSVRDTQAHGIYQVLGQNDFMVSNRLFHELDLHGPSVALRTACSASLIGVNEACMSIARGDCTAAIVGGTNIIMAPAFTAANSEQGVLSLDGSCNTFSANANGYGCGEDIVAIYLKPLADAVRAATLSAQL
ncbi:hypothetical protein AtubIFM56815_001580 [Aspergillus tubingensis]|uniref:Ketosynthase family 3 (KS3) domain-containing protein n=2 Tax=Aspergillus subgen. Circumdati TaxID=2720871 RepID=A0A100IS58_ASPNG|nr:hypothetical protein PTT_09821 [Aspergillus niger]GLA67262.1 hypothetical protein AtubIFM54640_010241 [Aspergillus tubingensis]GLA80748.1 hypothetical protein AtubIFM56815_001580 [Aspergillus tubingensis]GLA94029.1 hypothetical protein AtubIFM57143_000888 [Aspergillus tubingensis]